MITQLPTTNFTENFEPEFKQAIAFSDTVGAMNSVAYQPFIDAYKARKNMVTRLIKTTTRLMILEKNTSHILIL